MQALYVFGLICILLNVCRFPNANGTVDLNKHEIEFVADHLTNTECRRLSEALHMKHWRLDHPVTGSGEPNVTCLNLIKHWDTHEGRGKTFHDLALRLTQIGRHDLAAKLSRTVYKEKSDAVKRTFLTDPFRKMIHKNSPMLAEAATDLPTEDPNSKTDPFPWTRVHTTFTVLTVVCAIILSCLVCGMLPWKTECKSCKPVYDQIREDFYMRVSGMKPPKDENLFIVI